VGAGPGFSFALVWSLVIVLAAPIVIGVGLRGRPSANRVRRLFAAVFLATLVALAVVWWIGLNLFPPGGGY
jgi:hypothetical protein